MKKILITGASGFIGRNLVEQLNKKYKIIATSHNELDLLNEKFIKQYLKKNCFDIIIHSATHNATITSTKDTTLVLNNNLRMFSNIARCNYLYGKLLYYGSGAEYDTRNYIPLMNEDFFDKYVPDDAYGFSKYLMNKLTRSSQSIYNLRLFGVFGKYEDWRIRFISNACCKALLNLPITINQNVFFDYLYIDDLVQITEWFINNEMIYKDYNVCTQSPIDLLTLAEIIRNIANKDIPILINKPGCKREYSGNNSRLMMEMGKYDFIPIKKAISVLYDWYNCNKQIINEEYLFMV